MLVLVGGLAACGDDDTASTTAPSTTTEPEEPTLVELTQSGACGDAYFWAATETGNRAVTVTVEARDRSDTEPTTIPVDLDDVQILSGDHLDRNFCTDVLFTESEPQETLAATDGEGEIVLDPPLTAADNPCGANGTLTLDGLVAEDRTAFAPIEVSSDEIGCYAG